MSEIEISEYLEAHGDRAIVEAARKACVYEEKGEAAEAEIWRLIQAALKFMRGSHVS